MDHLQTDLATFGAGCFWGVQASFEALEGVIETTAGYAGGHTDNPTYEQVCRGNSGHAEVIQIKFNPAIINYETLITHFFNLHDPTTRNQQGPDIGTQYRSVIFYHTSEQQQLANTMIDKLNVTDTFKQPIVTEVVASAPFYPAEDYHQHYLAKRSASSCSTNS